MGRDARNHVMQHGSLKMLGRKIFPKCNTLREWSHILRCEGTMYGGKRY